MTSKLWTLLLLLTILACTGINAQTKIGFNQVLSHLGNFQSPSGGFRSVDGLDTVEATSSALLLSSLYGLNAKINTVEATKFLASLENKDAGYGSTVGAPSDVESVRNALAGLARLGAATNPTNTAAYLKTLVDKDTGLFAARVGEKGSIKATALALQSLELLSELKQKWVKDLFAGITAALKKADAFSDDVSANYYSIVVASLVGYELPAAKLVKSIVDLQSPQGLFYTDASRKAISLQATADALLSLYTLKSVDSVNTATLRAGLRYLPADLVAAANAHVALAVTKAFRENFVVVTGAHGGVIVEGTGVRPSVSVSAKESGGVSHSGFEVTSKHTFFGKQATNGKLAWSQDSQIYAGESLPTTGNFGPFESVYTLSTVIPGLGPLSFDVIDTKTIGYGIIVSSKATVELSGRDVKENEQVNVGTDFKFDVALSSHSNSKLLSGDFVVTFSVLDSSNVVIHESTIDGASNSAPISFTYKLNSPDVPAGALSFKFDVASKSGKVSHTSRTVSYHLAVALVASKILFDGSKGASYKLGETVKLSVEPATFPDLRTPHTLTTKNSKGEDATASRHFFLDVKSPQGTLLRTVEGTPTKSPTYNFQVPVEPTFSSLGVNTLSFRYKTASGEEIPLQNFDSNIGELYEDINVLNYTVKAELSLVDVAEKPKATELFYGDAVVFKFRVKDSVSGLNVVGTPNSPANVYLELQHEQAQGARPFTSVDIPAVSTGPKDHIVANWTINPNAHRGNGVLTLSVLDSDGKKIALKDSVSLKVSIGGEISVEPHTLSTSPLDTTSTAFVVEVGLFCREKPLSDAQLRANVVFVNNDKEVTLATLPVAHHGNHYTVSWSAPHKEARTGTYRVHFIREADRLLAADKKEQKEKKLRKEKQLRGEDASNVEVVSGEELSVEPIFSVTIPHTAPRFTRLPVKAEFAALVVFGGIVVWLINKRSNLK